MTHSRIGYTPGSEQVTCGFRSVGFTSEHGGAEDGTHASALAAIVHSNAMSARPASP